MTDKVFGVEDPKVKGKDDCQNVLLVGYFSIFGPLLKWIFNLTYAIFEA